MLIIDYIRIAVLLLLCVYCSITDIKDGIVKNTILLSAGGIGVLLYIIQVVAFGIDDPWIVFISILINAFISLLLYLFHVWAAGDCKMLLAVFILIPPSLSLHSRTPYISLILIPAFAFLFSFFFLIVDSIRAMVKQKHIVKKDKLIGTLKVLLIRYISTMSVVLLADKLLFIFFKDLVNRYWVMIIVINICLVIIVNSIRLFQKAYVFLPIIAVDIVLMILYGESPVRYLISFALVLLIMMIRIIISEYNYQMINTSEVEEGMILSTETTMLFLNSKVKGLPPISKEDLRSRLSKEEADSVKRWEKSKYGLRQVKTVRKIPFIIFISIGTLCYIVLGVMFS